MGEIGTLLRVEFCSANYVNWHGFDHPTLLAPLGADDEHVSGGVDDVGTDVVELVDVDDPGDLASYNRRSRNFESSLTFRDGFWRRSVGGARSTAQRQRT
jgi:hypothetical protein